MLSNIVPTSLCVDPNWLADCLGRETAPFLIDLRIPEDYALNPTLIPGSVRRAHDRLADWLPACPIDRPTVVICHRGQKLSQGVAALLRAAGRSAHALRGGSVAWADSGLPTIDPAHLFGAGPAEGSLWVTGENAALPQFVAGWALRRFIDRTARLLFVEQAEVKAVAQRFDGHPLDGEEGTAPIRSLLRRAGLAHPPLDRMISQVADDADERTGLRAIATGIAAEYGEPDARFAHWVPILDALHAGAAGRQSWGRGA